MIEHKKSSNHGEEKTSTPDVKKSNLFMIFVIIFLSIVTLITITKIINHKSKQSETTTGKENKPINKTIENEIPDVFTDYYLIKKDAIVRLNNFSYTEYQIIKDGNIVSARIKVPSGYGATYSGGGKNYFVQKQNGQRKKLPNKEGYQGDGNASYFDLSYCDEEITVACEFKKL